MVKEAKNLEEDIEDQNHLNTYENNGEPKTYLIWSIVNFLFFNFFLGLATVILSICTLRANKKRNYHLSEQTSSATIILNIFTSFLGVFLFSISVVRYIYGVQFFEVIQWHLITYFTTFIYYFI